jgi:hypothetical protein
VAAAAAARHWGIGGEGTLLQIDGDKLIATSEACLPADCRDGGRAPVWRLLNDGDVHTPRNADGDAFERCTLWGMLGRFSMLLGLYIAQVPDSCMQPFLKMHISSV